MVNLKFLAEKNVTFGRFGLKADEFLSHDNAILSEKRGIIYGIVNLVNGKIYIGLSKQSFQDRYEGNWTFFSGNKHLKRAAEKYGKDSFAILILEENLGLNILNILETYYILTFQSHKQEFGYNKTTGGDNNYRFSDDIKAKASYTKEEFVNLAIKKHGYKYNYDSTEYFSAKAKVKIFCNACQAYFMQTPASHLTGKGCLQCGLKSMGEKNLFNFEKFQERANQKFGNEYSFYKESFTRFSDGVVTAKHIACKTEFTKNPSNLLRQMTPCPTCHGQLSIKWGKTLRNRVNNTNISKGILEKSYKDYIAKLYNIHGNIFTCLGYTTKSAGNGWNKIIIKQKCNNCKYEFLRERRYIDKKCPNCIRLSNQTN